MSIFGLFTIWLVHYLASSHIMLLYRFRFRFILFYFVSIQHTVTVMYKKNEIIKYADMEAPIKTIYGLYHRATRKINYTDHT